MRTYIIFIAMFFGLMLSACGTASPTEDAPKPQPTLSMEAEIKAEFTTRVAEQDPDIRVDGVNCIERKDDVNALCYADLVYIPTGQKKQTKITVTKGEDGSYIWEAEAVYFL